LGRVSSVARRCPAVVLSTVPVDFRFGAFTGSGPTICQRSPTILLSLAALCGPSLTILQGVVTVQRSFPAGSS
jgi:hypothetical protein